MTANKTHIIGLMVCILTIGTTAQAASIWARRNQTAKPLFADDKANQVGDLLTIVISEDHKVDNKVKRDLSRDSSRQLGIGEKDISIEHVLPTVSEVNIDLQSSKSLKGKSDYKDETNDRRFDYCRGSGYSSPTVTLVVISGRAVAM